jgi:L-2-hydroxyglutarate oxidase LhgO
MISSELISQVDEITYLTEKLPGHDDVKWKIRTKSGRVIHSCLVINCAGLFGDEIDAMGLNV